MIDNDGGIGEEKVLLVDIFFIDRHLLRLIDHHQYLPANHTEMNVRIDVGTQSGSWIVKCRDNRTIVNNRDTISPLFLTVDAWLSFRTTRDFWDSTKTGVTLTEAQKRYRVKGTGKEAILLQMWSALCAIGSAEEKNPAGSTSSSASTPLGGYNGHIMNNHRVNSTMEQLPARVLASALSLKKSHKDRERERSQTLSEILPLPKDVSLQLVLKAGSLLKKKDILVGWQSRYFVVLPGRVEYYLDEHAYQTGQPPRATIQLYGADIITSKLVTVNGGEHHAITVEPMARAKTFRVASEKPGGIGKEDIEMWGTELLRASTYGYNQHHSPYSQSQSASRMTPHTTTSVNNNNNNGHTISTSAPSTVPSSSSRGRSDGGSRMRPIAASSGLHVQTHATMSPTTTSASATTNSTLSAATTSSSSPSRSTSPTRSTHNSRRHGIDSHPDGNTSPDSTPSSPERPRRTRAPKSSGGNDGGGAGDDTDQDNDDHDDNEEHTHDDDSDSDDSDDFPASEKAHYSPTSSSSSSAHKTNRTPSPIPSFNAMTLLLLFGSGLVALVASYRASGVKGAAWCGMILMGWCTLVRGVSWNKNKGLPVGPPTTTHTKRHKHQQQHRHDLAGPGQEGRGVPVEAGRVGGVEGPRVVKGSKGASSSGPGIEVDKDKAKGGASRGKFKFLQSSPPQQQQQQHGDS